MVTCVGACMNSAIFSGSMRPLSISSDTAEDVPSRPTSLHAWRMVPSKAGQQHVGLRHGVACHVQRPGQLVDHTRGLVDQVALVRDGPLKAGGGDADLGDAVAHLRQGAAEQLLLISPRSRDGVLRGDVDGVGGGRDAGGRSIYVAAKRLQIVQVTLQLGVAGGQGIDGESQLLLVRIGVGHLIVHDLRAR